MYLTPDSSQNDYKRDVINPQGRIVSRQTSPDSNSDSTNSPIWTMLTGIIVGIVILLILIIFLYKYVRQMKMAGRSPRYIPTKFLKQKWEAWQPKNKYANLGRDRTGSDLSGVGLTTTRPTVENGVNRNTSVRSVATLPAYSQKPKDTEEVIGREGERGGIDTVVELPETVDEEEERREAEMESLYQIRVARRQEIAEREERRRERREARERGDFARLEELRRESRSRRDQTSLANLAHQSGSNVNLTSEMLLAEHNSRGRDRRVSSVSYAAVGQVRHDGTRIRSNSNDSEHSGLLNSAAPMGQHNRNGSDVTLLSLGGLPQPRYRDRSNSGAASIATTASSFDNVSPPSEDARPTTARTAASSHFTGGSLSDVSTEEVDLGNERTVVSADSDDVPQPPEYDGHEWGEAPEYTEREQQQMSRANTFTSARSRIEESNNPEDVTSRNETLSIVPPRIQIETPTAPNTPVVPRSSTDAM